MRKQRGEDAADVRSEVGGAWLICTAVGLIKLRIGGAPHSPPWEQKVIVIGTFAGGAFLLATSDCNKQRR